MAQIDTADLAAAVRAWSSPDDWNVPAIYADTVVELADALAAGVDPYVLVRHAGHSGRHCCRLARPGADVTLVEAWRANGRHS